MEKLLRDIIVFPDVSGVFVYNRYKGILTQSDMPTAIKKESLGEIGVTLGRVFEGRDALNGIEMRFGNGLVFARPIADHSSLVTFCGPGVNGALLNMTISMLLPKIKKSIEDQEKPTPKPPKQEAVEKSAPEPTPPPAEAEKKQEPVDVDALLQSGPLTVTLGGFQSALAFAIGPISEMVMHDCLEEWSKGGDCAKDRLADLAPQMIPLKKLSYSESFFIGFKSPK